MMQKFTHINKSGRPRMVDVGDKDITKRRAVAEGEILMAPSTVRRIKDKDMKKGDVLSAAQVAGISGAKKTWDLIPMCHNIAITGCDIDFTIMDDRIKITATLSTAGKTGIEMEALTAVSIAALTLYDMCKAVDKAMKIENIRLLSKMGGQSGDWVANE